MRYLKTYKIFESYESGEISDDEWQVQFDYMRRDQKEEIYQECLDILREIEDNGYEVTGMNDLFDEDPSISFFIVKHGIMHSQDFWIGIKDTFERLKDYLSEYGFYTEDYYKYKKLDKPRIDTFYDDDGYSRRKRMQITFCLK